MSVNVKRTVYIKGNVNGSVYDNVNVWVKKVTLRFSGVRRAANKKNRATTALPLNEGS